MMGHRCEGQDLPTNEGCICPPPTPVEPFRHVWAVLDRVPYEGEHLIRLFDTEKLADDYADDAQSVATGRLIVKKLGVFDK